MLEASTFMEVDAAPEAAAGLSAEDAAAHAEQQYADELQKELTGRADADATAPDEQPEAPEQAVKVQSITCRPVIGRISAPPSQQGSAVAIMGISLSKPLTPSIEAVLQY